MTSREIDRQTYRFPDFIIGGAPKCGTTSLHFILAQHPDIGIPHDEVFYFDADDPIVHPDFLHAKHHELNWWDPDPTLEDNLRWYADRFSGFKDKALVGEDSTTYLMSDVAPRRIDDLLPNAKIIFMLRNPVKRAYSQYWHLMKTGRVSQTFEEILISHPSVLLGSTYTPNIRRFIDQIGKDRVHVIIFEEFLKDMQREVDIVTDFIGASRMELSEGQTWFNKTYYPTNGRAQRYLNLVGKRIVASKYRNHMASASDVRSKMRNKVHYWWFKYVNKTLLKAEKPEAMKAETERYLKKHLTQRNAGLSEILNKDMSQLWGLDV